MKPCWNQQTKFKNLMVRQLTLHKDDINALADTLDDLSHATKYLSKHLDMVQVQCDQIAKAQDLIVSQKDFSKAIATNVVTRQGTETHEPTGPSWYQEEQACKAKELEGMSQEEKDLVDRHDDMDYEEQRKQKETSREENTENQAEVYDFDAQRKRGGKTRKIRRRRNYIKKDNVTNIFVFTAKLFLTFQVP
jgi:hypothetical protein